eukprot:scaffold34639_cov206-Amphora_coffeaeformis.AAC.9
MDLESVGMKLHPTTFRGVVQWKGQQRLYLKFLENQASNCKDCVLTSPVPCQLAPFPQLLRDPQVVAGFARVRAHSQLLRQT